MKSGIEHAAAMIAAASNVVDPIEHLLECVKLETTACFEDEHLEELRTMRAEYPARYQKVRLKLQALKVNVRELDKLTDCDVRTSSRSSTQGALLGIASQAELFKTPAGEAFADVQVNGHRETLAVDSTGFRNWLLRGYFDLTESSPSNEPLNSVLATLTAKAQFGEPTRDVYTRIASHEGKLYIDLADTHWRAIEVDRTGWRVVTDAPVRFRRSNGMLALPDPARNGSLDALRPFLNVQSDEDFILVVSWLSAALRDGGPYPVLVLSGEQGSSKTTFATFLRRLVDPCEAPLVALPKDEWNLFITASNSHVLAFDNVSGLSPWLSDGLCKIATGGSLKTRKLYTTSEEITFRAVKPVILNGIGQIVTRPDLGDRALFVELRAITDAQRRPLRELEADFEDARPRILGAILELMVAGLQNLSSVEVPTLPRMADFAKWSVACESGLGPTGCFMAAYDTNRKALIDDVLEGDPVASAVLSLVEKHPSWRGTAKQLLPVLGRDFAEANRKGWPNDPRSLSNCLTRMVPFLRKKGVVIERSRDGHNRDRIISISATSRGAGDELKRAA